MKELLKQSRLYDFYGELLTESQREILEMYYFEDLSLSEIAETRGTSRAAVHDLIRRSEAKLEGYEEKLHLVERFLAQSEELGRMVKLVRESRENEGNPEAVPASVRSRLDRILDEALAETKELSGEP